MQDIIAYIGIGLIFGLAGGGALAQTMQQKQTPQEQALTQQVLDEMNTIISLRVQIFQLQDELTQLKAKADPPPPPAGAKPEK